ncbi:MAG: hypothetical protein GXO97_06510 [Nitrospirae bacterium]|nr:hypothetical protein [Nitrospirota bacterium]
MRQTEVVHHPIDAMGFKILKKQSIFSLQVIHKVVDVSYSRYCYMVFFTTSVCL